MKLLVLCNSPYVVSPTTEILKNLLNTSSFKGAEIFLLCLENKQSNEEYYQSSKIIEYSFDYENISAEECLKRFRIGFLFKKLIAALCKFFKKNNIVEINIIYKKTKEVCKKFSIDNVFAIEDANNSRSRSLIKLKKKNRFIKTSVFWVEMPKIVGTISFDNKYLTEVNKYIDFSFVRNRDYIKFENKISKNKLIKNEFPCELINYNENNSFNNEILYFGRLRPEDKNTKLLLNLIDHLNEYNFIFYLTNYDEVIEKIDNKTNVVFRKATPINLCHKVISSCAALLCIESTTTVGQTCKYITYMSSGKPILFVGSVHNLDEELNKYKAYFVADSDPKFSDVAKFLREKKSFDYTQYSEVFPDYSNENIGKKIIESHLK